jgi:diguanylate cyclase (GGDEF)-like protein
MILIFVLVEWRLAQLVRVLESQNRQLSHQRARLHHQAHHDALTDLPNRSFLYQYLNEVIVRSHLNRMLGAVLMIDLNRFKEINDTLGHDVGDQVLREMATQLSKMKRKDDMVARWGGDEFVFILEGLKSAEDALAFARRLYRDVSYTIARDSVPIFVTLSIGVCMFSKDQTDIQTIMKRADTAMYRAKAQPEDKVALDAEPSATGLGV